MGFPAIPSAGVTADIAPPPFMPATPPFIATPVVIPLAQSTQDGSWKSFAVDGTYNPFSWNYPRHYTRAMLEAYDSTTGIAALIRLVGTVAGGLYVNQQMPSKGANRLKREYNASHTASATIFTVTAGYEFHLVDLLISGSNTSVAANTHFRLRDGGAAGTIKYEFRHATAGVGTPEHFSQEHTYSEHPVFATGVYLEIVTGTLTLAMNLHGYEAS